MPSPLVELTEAIELCLPDGRVNPRAIGYSRRPLHRTHLTGWGRNKRWEYWGIVTPTHILGLTISNLDYAAVHQIYLLDRASGRERELDRLVPLGRGAVLPDDGPPVHARATARGLRIELDDTDTGTRIVATGGGVDVELVSPREGDCLGVVVPWSERRFQYTVKAVARPIGGALTVDGQRIAVAADQAWAVLDRGRGRWPYRITWNWGAGSGVVDGKRIGLQLGGTWTAGTGSTECALFVDGRMHYLPDEPTWTYDPHDWSKPWHVRGARVDATLVPFHVRAARVNALVIANTTHQAFGVWHGWATTDDGTRVPFEGLVGWAEEVRNRW